MTANGGSPADELVEWVDEDGATIEVVTRGRMRAENLRHRSVYIVVRSAADEVLVHRRADWKDVFASHWDVAFGGVCDVGEAWEPAAVRELAEEAGVEALLTDRGPFTHTDDHVAIVGRLFEARTTGPFTFADGEVAEVAWVPRAGLLEWAADRPVTTDGRDSVVPEILAWPPPT
ncbi:MAG: NUDIX domain-containing protein [Actinomycetota bacterium]|nr:NUDIX domain-containing protein [Actinomycetota bacterium]